MLTLRDALSLIFKRKAVIFVFFLSLVAAAFIALKVMSPTYAATSKILVKIGREDIYLPSVTSDALVSPLMSVVREEQLNSEVQILTSDNLAAELIGDMTPEGLYPGMFDHHPWYTPKGWLQMAKGVYTALDNYFAPLSANPSRDQKALKRFMRKDLRVQGTGNSNVIEVTVYSKVPQLAADAANRLVDLYLTERTRIHNDEEGVIFEAQMKDMESRIETAQDELQAFREQHKLTDVDEERETILKRIGETRAMIVDLQGRPSEAQRLGKWRTELKQLEDQLKNIGGEELEYVRLVQSVEVLKKSRQLYLEKLEEYKINAALSSARIGNVSVISKAIPPNAPVSPKLWMVLLAVLAVGLIGGMALALLVELMDDTVETDNHVQKYLGLPVLTKVGTL